MSTSIKHKWIVSFILGGVLLALAMLGGGWKISYASDANTIDPPHIDSIFPDAVPAGSGNVMMIIGGTNFGVSESYIRVWIHDEEHDYKAAPFNVEDTSLSVIITDTLLVGPDIYIIKIVKSNGLSIPTVPPNPTFDQVSNAVDFIVYQPQYVYLPIIRK